MLLDGKAAIVTGSARGIGRATAELLAQHGARVLINDLDAELRGATAAEIDGETAVFGGDLTDDGVPRGAGRALRRPRSDGSTSWSTTPATRGTAWRTR